MGDEDGVDQVKKENDGVVALGGARTRIYKGDVDDVGQVRKAKASSLVEVGHTLTSRGLVVSASKPLEDSLLVYTSKPDVDGLVG